jgi:stage II sporulation protein Q
MKPEQPNNNVKPINKMKWRLRWKRLFSKKWAFPAIYLAAAALILSLVWWYSTSQEPGQKPTTGLEEVLKQEPVENINAPKEMILPVAENAQAKAKMGFYNDAGSDQSKETSLVKYENTYWPHSGVDFAREDGKSFDVVAALDGKVIRVEENPMVGHLVEIQHDNGLVTVYQSLSDVKVKEGQTVSQGDLIARAGENSFEKDAGVHLHFEVRKDGQPLNPEQYLN